MEIVRGVEGLLGSIRTRLVTNGGNGRRDVFHVKFDPETENVTEVVVRSVAVIHNVEPTELPPLGRVVDLDAISAMVGAGSRRVAAGAQVTFVYEDLEITIGSEGDVWLEWV